MKSITETSDYIRTGGLPIQLPQDLKLLEIMRDTQKRFSSDPDILAPIERELKRLTEGVKQC